MLERDVEKPVTNHAKKRGWYSIKLNGPGNRGKPDRLFFTGPPFRVMFVEFKRPGGIRRPLQKWWIRLLKKCGAPAYFIDNIDEGKALFDAKPKRP